MSQPWQLAKAHKPRRSSRPILEALPAVSTTELRISSIYQGKHARIKPLKIPNIESVKVGPLSVEFRFESLHRGSEGPKQTFRLKPIRVGFGIRYAFICSTCGKGRYKLHAHNRSLLCRHCIKARSAAQAVSRLNRPVLQAARLEAFLTKPLWRRTRERLLKRFGHKLMQPQTAYGTEARNL